MDKQLQRSRLGVRLLLQIFAALFVAVMVFMSVTTTWGILRSDSSLVEEAYEKQIIDNAMAEFQEYVTANRLASTDYLMLSLWLRQVNGVGFVYGEAAPDAPYTIAFTDETVAVYPYVVPDRFTAMVNIIATVLALSCFLLILIPYVQKLANDIAQLSRDMDILTSGDLTHEVTLARGDELEILAHNIDDMRLSVAQQFENEKTMVQANQELITSLSHDLRTPLTKALGYLEILQRDPALGKQNQDYVKRIHKAILQVKERSDQLLKYSLNSPKPQDTHTRFDGVALLEQLETDLIKYLQTHGASMKRPPKLPPFHVTVHPIDIERIFDNIASNIIKYADFAYPVLMKTSLNNERVIIEIENRIRDHIPRGESTGIGLVTAKKLALRNNGFFQYQNNGRRFTAVLKLQAERLDMNPPPSL